MLLILTSDKDFTADFLITELIKRQLPYFRVNAEDLPRRPVLPSRSAVIGYSAKSPSAKKPSI